MKPWPLLVFLLLSDLSPPTDGDWIMDYFKWRLCRKVRLKVSAWEYKTLRWVSKTPKAQDQTLRDVFGAIPRTPASALANRDFFPEEEKLVPVLHVVSSKSVWLHRHVAASGLEESKSRLPVTAAHQVAPCCPHDGEMRSAAQEEAGPRMRAADVKERLNDHRRRPVIRRHHAVRAAQLETSARLKGHEEFSPPLKTSWREEGVSVLKQLLLVSRKNKGSKNTPQYVIRPDDNEYFSGKIITKESEPPVLGGDGKPARSHSKTAAYSVKTEALMQIFLPETNLESLFDFPRMTDFISGPECKCSDEGERSAEKDEGIKSSEEDEEYEIATPREKESELSSSVSNYKEDRSPLPTTFQPEMTETTTETTKIPETTRRAKETTTSSEVNARLVAFTAETTTTKLLSGLRMKANVHTTLMDDTDESRRDQQTEPPKPEGATQKESLRPEAEGGPAPLCGGLIARSQSGWKHCMERLGRFSSTEAPDVRRQKEGGDPRSDDGNEHFYYFDGVMKKVPVNSDPLNQRQRL
ncbi:hypothetical protein OJAV_G00122820 [Oryzias javanicus]|uniref:Uncharacterized protein n=1 Tax=Oryzias javanicus TaxID=123683 RepID=A0A437CT48_ORYJA|nr:hypothetical protein OJAV_G00122820 [Oryzias javanicus]